MRRASKGYYGVDTLLFQTMHVQGQTLQGEGSTIPVESHHTPTSAPSTSQPPTSPTMQITHNVEETATMPHDSSHQRKVESFESDLKQTKLTYGAAYTKLIMRVKKLEHKVKSNQSRRRARVVISNNEEDLEDPSKQGRKIAEIDQNPSISLVQDEGTSWIQEDAEIQGRTSADTKILLDQEEPTEPVEVLGSSEKGEKEISTANVPVSTAKEIPEEVSTGEPDIDVTLTEALVDLLKNPKEVARREVISPPIDEELALKFHVEEQAELERLQKERATQDEASNVALAEEFDEIQVRIDGDHELAVRLTHEEEEKYTIKEKARLLAEFFERRKRQLAAKRAEAIRNKPPTRTQVRNSMITYLKHMGKYTHQQLKHKTFEEVQKLYEREKKWIDDFEPMDDDNQQQAEGTKKRPRADSVEESSKKKKLEEENDAEKEELRASMDVVPKDDIVIDMLDDFDKQDVIDLHKLVNERYETTSPEGCDLLLWGDLRTLFEPDEEDEIWKNQHDYNLISWRLFDSCGVHILLMNTRVAIHMMIEKTYPLTQEMLSRMINRRLEVDHESEMTFELISFNFISIVLKLRLSKKFVLKLRKNWHNLVIGRNYGAANVMKDGITVAKTLKYKDEIKNICANLVNSQVANATNDGLRMAIWDCMSRTVDIHLEETHLTSCELSGKRCCQIPNSLRVVDIADLNLEWLFGIVTMEVGSDGLTFITISNPHVKALVVPILAGLEEKLLGNPHFY
ncbi:ribonuclease H-like domain-containing protein [Tanacetum coccineum]